MTDEPKSGAAEKERQMREHEREARERDSDERDAEGAQGGDPLGDPSSREPSPPGQGGAGTNTGS